jgi:phosphatidylethanolamine/phosphatidyl-N-methylethanolamine N-methyltransferase
MLLSLKSQIAFFRQFRKRFETTGAIAPSSRFLACSMVRFLSARNPDVPVRVLEIGPGTGPVTNEIVRTLRPGDVFDLVELNGEFVAFLKNRFLTEPAWQAVQSQSTIHQQPVQDFETPEPYDFVISGLPLNNFPADLVSRISQAYLRLLKPGGVLSYFEYMYVRPIRRRVTLGNDRQRIASIDDTLSTLCEHYRIQRDSIWINIPPAWVQHLRKPDASPSSENDASCKTA